jgi:hypothetical protein
MKIRCRNCGLWHGTNVCPSYGPMFPAPGKTAADYEELRKKIQDRVAADIVAEHEGTETEEGEVIVVRRRRKKADGDQGSKVPA